VHPEIRPNPTPITARLHLHRVIEEFGSDGDAAGEVVIDLTGSDAVVILPSDRAEHREAERASTVLAPVLNRARYRRGGIDGVSTRPGELSELATLVDSSAEPDVLRLVLAAQRRPKPPTATPDGDPAARHPSAHRPPTEPGAPPLAMVPRPAPAGPPPPPVTDQAAGSD
jgi:hypothetical protein